MTNNHDNGEWTLHPARIAAAPKRELPPGKRLPRGWTAVPLGGRAEPLRLEWPRGDDAPPAAGKEGRLRIAAALDFRGEAQVEVVLAGSGESLGVIDIRYAYAFQPFELLLDGEKAEAARREGVELFAREEGPPLWMFDALADDEERRAFAPHLLTGCGMAGANGFLARFASLASLQPFGWMEGCVLDGLHALRPLLGAAVVDRVIERHLVQFIDEDGKLRYEDLYGRSADDAFTTIEATLPLGVIVKQRPDHPVVRRAVAFWDAHGSGGAIADGDMVSAEGLYTVAYPLAAVASRQGRPELAAAAVRQALVRRDRLARGSHVYLRYYENGNRHEFRSWSRAFAWYMLGLARTWIELRDAGWLSLPGAADMERELRRAAEAALAWRGPERLWYCFLDEPHTGVETSGSAGIAAAMALGASAGVLSPEYGAAARECWDALLQRLTPDGLLGGVAQHNAGGMALQRSGYRVLSQMGMGLMAQLYAALHDE